MRPSSRRHVLGVTASLVIAALSPAIAQEQSRAAKGPETSLISTVLTGKERLGRKWMDEQRIEQLQGPDRQAGDQAAAGHLLSCLPDRAACANTGIKHEAAAAAPAAAGGRARAARHAQAPAGC